MNLDEYNQTFGQKAKSITDLFHATDRIMVENQLNALVITCGEEGIFAQTQEKVFHVQVPTQPVLSAAGAGDVASAALVWRFASGDDWFRALQWAGAASAASVLTEATGEVKLEDVNTLFPLVKVNEILSYTNKI